MSEQHGSDSLSPVIPAPEPHAHHPRTIQDWWPDQLDLRVLASHSKADPIGKDFDYPSAVEGLDVDAVKADVMAVMTDSQDWWPADYGHYGPMFIRLSWHSAGTYRTGDGRGGGGSGAQRFAPLNSWPDNANLDKARRLLWPVKAKYGAALSWADLIVFAGNCAIESMGLETFGFAFGRPDVFEPTEMFWGSEDTWLGDERYSGDRELEGHLGAVQMGLIYVNPEGPNGNPDPMLAARDIRETFGRMAMNDEETVALIAGGHTFGKAHGAHSAEYVGPEPEGCPIGNQGLGWMNSYGTGNGADTVTSGLEGAWSPTPTEWGGHYYDTMFKYEWELEESPAGAKQWRPTDRASDTTIPDAHDPSKTHAPMMFTTDLALMTDPAYREISERFHEHPEQLGEAFAKAWYKLLHRDMGPVSRLRGPWVAEPQLWQDPVPAVDHELVGAEDIAALKAKALDSGCSPADLIFTAWSAAACFRGTDKRGGANGARLRLAPQNTWEVNEPTRTGAVIDALDGIRTEWSSASTGAKISLADMIVLAGCAAVERAAADAGAQVTVPFTPGRTDATAEMTDAEAMAVLEPRADGFRNYYPAGEKLPPETLLLDRANMLNLTAFEMTALVGGLRALGVNHGDASHGVLTERPGVLTNDFFVNLLAPGTVWKTSEDLEHVYEIRDLASGETRWTATDVDLVFGSNSQLRAISEVYGASDGQEALVRDFVAAWDKVMMADRFDV